MKLRRFLFFLILMLALASSAYSQTDSTSRRFEVRRPDHLAPSLSTLAPVLGKAKVLASYPRSTIVDVPDAEAKAFEQLADQAGFEVEEVDDSIRLPARAIESRMLPRRALQPGVQLIQFAAPLLPAWEDDLRKLGVEVLERFAERTLLVDVPAGAVGALSSRPPPAPDGRL
jgi:hypothetical protein